ncbi:CD99 antigen-like protein 2 isoform X2 [Hemiscyllium ocellatum]|uniref:CD99 antigen-like protein 2 isoform X2 n=1 Tax=Hemiscyllium ocellatum TaxID=170820 RepID=UPI00296727F0|nr:CD99 antigen-like protein 2 isoform X2 [Hemiscyllium ocellatum]
MLLVKNFFFGCLTFALVRTYEGDDGFDLSDALKDDPAKSWDDNDGFDLNDALKEDFTKPKTGSSFDDSDLQDVVNGDYKPEKTKAKAQDPPTVIDIIIDLVMALIGGTSEQVKRLCYSLLEMFTEQYMNVQNQ